MPPGWRFPQSRLEGHRERDPDSESRVDERGRPRPASTCQKQRADAEKCGRQEGAAEVVHAKHGIAPTGGRSPGESTRGDRVGGERHRPGGELGRAAIAISAHEVRREAERDERRGEREEGLHDAGL